jgi:hypothetical protein
MEKKLSYGYLDLFKKSNHYPLGNNQLNICKGFNLDVQYPHAIDTSMTIHMQRGIKYPKLKQKQKNH